MNKNTTPNQYRLFLVSYTDPKDGTLHEIKSVGNTPKRAAEKALCRISRMSNLEKVYFRLREITRNCEINQYWYEGIKAKLDPPVEINIGDKTLVYRFRYDVQLMTSGNKVICI